MSEFVAKIRALALALGGPGLFLVAFLDSSFLPLPGITDVLLVVTVTRNPSAMLGYVAMTVIGSVGGCLALHYLGRKGGEALVRRKFTGETIEHGQPPMLLTETEEPAPRRRGSAKERRIEREEESA